MNHNNNMSVLPFYQNIEEQNHRRTYAYGEVYPLYTPKGTVPPFQIIREHNGATISTVRLYKVGEAGYTDIKQSMTGAGLAVSEYSGSGYDIVVFPSLAPHNITKVEGRQYIVLTMSDGDTYYSDIFTVVADMSGFLNISWWDVNDYIMDDDRISYANGFKNSVWLNTQLGKPEYEFEEDGETRDGQFFPIKQVSWKKYKCTFLASEYLCDVLRFVRLSDFAIVRDSFGHIFRCDTFLCTPKWEDQGDIASVDVEFTCDTVAKKITQAYSLDAGDFNDDFNNDFDITDNN